MRQPEQVDAKSQPSPVAATESNPAPTHHVSDKPLRVVILDDEGSFREMLTVVICQEYPQAEITEYDDGDKAWDGLMQHDPDLFIFDDAHSGIRGREIVRRLADRKAPFAMIFATGVPTYDEYVKQTKERGGLPTEPPEAFELLPAKHHLQIKVLRKPFELGDFQAAMLEVGIKAA